MNVTGLPSSEQIQADVSKALREDIGSGDVASTLLPEDACGTASLICQESAILCGQAWFSACFRTLDPDCQIHWRFKDADAVAADQLVCRLSGLTRALLSAERTALNFLQTLSGTATAVAAWMQQLPGNSGLRLTDTRKTLPGLRLAQKYAVRCGGAENHRMGLYDLCLIKENHIRAWGGVEPGLSLAKDCQVPVEIEVENLSQLQQALDSGAVHIMLDNMSEDALREAVRINAGKARLEVSGNVCQQDLARLASIGIDEVSVGALTKHIRAIDFSLRLD